MTFEDEVEGAEAPGRAGAGGATGSLEVVEQCWSKAHDIGMRLFHLPQPRQNSPYVKSLVSFQDILYDLITSYVGATPDCRPIPQCAYECFLKRILRRRARHSTKVTSNHRLLLAAEPRSGRAEG